MLHTIHKHYIHEELAISCSDVLYH